MENKKESFPFELLLMIYDTIEDVDDKINFDLAIHPDKSRYIAVKQIITTLTLPIIQTYQLSYGLDLDWFYSIYFVGLPIPRTQKAYQIMVWEYGIKVNLCDSESRIAYVFNKSYSENQWEESYYGYDNMYPQSGKSTSDGPSITTDQRIRLC